MGQIIPYDENRMNKELEESLNNSYLVRRRLATLRKLEGDPFYQLKIGAFNIRMYTNANYSDPVNREFKSVIEYNFVSVQIWEITDNNQICINPSTDYRFNNFYEENMKNSGSRLSVSITIPILCDLIKHIDRIVELTPFH